MRDLAFSNRIVCGGNGRVKQREREIAVEESTRHGPSHWWFPYPLLAGTFGPIASAFSICALAVPWRVVKSRDKVEELESYIADPKWLIGINAAQLAVALISNLFLFLNMAGRVKFPIGPSVVICGWYISSISLFAMIAAVKSALPSEYGLTQAYYYAAFSAVIYFIIASMIMVTLFGYYRGHYDEEFKLTVRRRSLMIQTSSFLLYLLLGAAVYAHVEGWEYLDSVYWADYTILTVGIGDFVPRTHLGRSLLFPFATGGIVIFGLIICTIRSLVIDRGKWKMGANMVESLRQKAQKNPLEGNEDGRLIPVGSSHTRLIWISKFQSSRQEFELMRQIQDQAIIKRRWTSLIISAFAWFVLWLVSASIFKATERAQSWSYFDSLYFTFTSLLTIGYGDFYPTSSAGKAYFVFWSLLAVPSLTILISNMGGTIMTKITDVLLWAGDFTIFAHKGVCRASIKRAAYRLTKASRFNSDVHETESRSRDGASQHSQTYTGFDPKRSAIATQSFSPPAATRVQEAALIQESKKNLLCLLVKEIGILLTHSQSCHPKRYTFDEWAWYFKLLGEGESCSGMDKVSTEIRDGGGESLNTARAATISTDRQDGKGVNWSWIGDQSPLTADKGEPDWLLERLLKKVERELKGL